ncbi:MAG: methyltransferase, partial [Polyangiaceae bacterium]
VDVDGGDGTLMMRLLETHAHIGATVFDRPEAASAASKRVAARRMEDRCKVVSGDFFVDVPRGGDVYVLARVLHDWNDDKARAILEVVAAAMASDATLLIVDDVLPPGDAPHPCKWVDLQMLAVTGGRERAEAEWRSLLASVNLELSEVLQRGVASAIVARRLGKSASS